MSADKKSRSEVTAADDKVLGFEYQYYYFLYCLLNLREGEQVGLEVKDDVHIDQPSGVTILSQLKHTVSPGQTNLTELDADFWKTIHNWLLLVLEQGASSTDPAKQLQMRQDFCLQTKFVLVTNKPVGSRNTLIAHLTDWQNGMGTQTLATLRDYIAGLNSSSTDIAAAIQQLLALDVRVLAVFLRAIQLEADFDDLLGRIHKRLFDMMIAKSRLGDVCRALDGALRQANYQRVKERKKFILSHEDFHKYYQIYFDIGRSEELSIADYDCTISNPVEQRFIQQLIDVGDIVGTNLDDIIRYTTHRLMAYNNLINWLQQGLITESQLNKFVDDSTVRWRNAFKKAHRSLGSSSTSTAFEVLVDRALACLDDIRGQELALRGQALGMAVSNGQFYSLSEAGRVGWLLDWETRYGAQR